MDIIQFYIPRLAAVAVDVDRLKFRARDHGIADARAETSYIRTGGRCRVRCRLPIAELLAQELRAAMDATTTEVVRDACARALVSIEEAKRLLAQPPGPGDSFFGA
jgi:hypothetical protein